MFPITTSSIIPSSSPSISTFISSHPPLSLLETKCTTMRELHQLHSQIIKSGLARDPFAISRLLSFSATSDLNYATLLLSHTPDPTNFMYNTLIRAYSKSSDPNFSISLFLQMSLNSPTRPNRLTFPPLFTAYTRLGLARRHGTQLHGLVFKLGFVSDPYIHNALVNMYSTCGYLDEACRLFDKPSQNFDPVPFNSMIVGFAKKGLLDESRRLFDKMPARRNSVSWSAMISGYVRNGKNVEALDLFRRMQTERTEPNVQTMVSLLGACASLGALHQGEWIHSYMEKKKKNYTIESNSIVTTAIVNMYCKCGSIEKAIRFFESVTIKGLSTWNAMISGLAIHGRGDEACRMFSRLESSGLKPDRVSFVSVLSACNHSGLVDFARYYFSRMIHMYGIEPGIEHYGCLVDVLARAGMIEEAGELVSRMHIEPDCIVWGSLVSACRNHGKVKIGEEAIAWDSGVYVILSNGYAGRREFGDAVNVRVAMKEKGVWKEPGCSLIEVNGQVNEFVCAGMLHSQSREICEVLDVLNLEMREKLCCTYTD